MADQQSKKPAGNTAAFSATCSGSSSSSSRSTHCSMSSAFLGVPSSPTHSHSQRRSSPSPYPRLPAPAPSSTGRHLASGRSAGSSSSEFNNQMSSPSPAAPPPYRRCPRPSIQRTHSLPSPFLSELSSIRRIGATVFGDLTAQEMTRSQLMLHAQAQQQGGQEMTPSSSSFSNLQPLPGGSFSGFPLPAPLQPQQMQPSSSNNDLPASRMIFSGSFEPPAEAMSHSMHFTNLAPLPASNIFQSSSSCSAYPDLAQQSSSDAELPPLPPSLEIQQSGLLPPLGLGHLSNNTGSSTESSSSAGFVQPPSSNSETSYELAPLPPSLQIPPPPLLLQQVMKQEPVVFAPSSLVPEIISLDDDGDDLSALVHSFASSTQHAPQWGGSANQGGGGQTFWEDMAPTPASVHNDGGGSSSSIPWNCDRSMPMLHSQSQQQALQQLNGLLPAWSSTVSSSSAAGSCSQGWAGMPALANKFDTMRIGGSSCGGVGPSEMPWNYGSMSVQSSTPVPAMPKLVLGGMDRHGLPPRPPPAVGAGASSSSMSRWGVKEDFFSQDDMEKIRKENRLQELLKTDPKMVKRIIRNRVHVARLKARKENYVQDLQHRVDALNMECSSLSAQVQSHQEMIVNLKTKNREMQIKLEGLNEQDNLRQVLNQHLQSEVQRLKLLELNMMCANGIHSPKSSQMQGCSASSSANGLHQLMHSHANDLISSHHQLQAQGHTTRLQLEEQPNNQTVDDELMDEHQQP